MYYIYDTEHGFVVGNHDWRRESRRLNDTLELRLERTGKTTRGTLINHTPSYEDFSTYFHQLERLVDGTPRFAPKKAEFEKCLKHNGFFPFSSLDAQLEVAKKRSGTKFYRNASPTLQTKLRSDTRAHCIGSSISLYSTLLAGLTFLDPGVAVGIGAAGVLVEAFCVFRNALKYQFIGGLAALPGWRAGLSIAKRKYTLPFFKRRLHHDNDTITVYSTETGLKKKGKKRITESAALFSEAFSKKPPGSVSVTFYGDEQHIVKFVDYLLYPKDQKAYKEIKEA